MPPVDLSFASDPTTLTLALAYGVIPALIWIYYWLQEVRDYPRIGGILLRAFAVGAFGVILVLPVQQWIATLSNDNNVLNILWAGSEELMKFTLFAIFVMPSSGMDRPAKFPAYLMIVALGFAGFENSLYFLSSLQSGDTLGLILDATTRFIGSTLLHAICASLAGFGIGFAYYHSKWRKALFAGIGLSSAIVLHSLFNYLVGLDNVRYFLVFGILWIVVAVSLVLFEKLRQMGSVEHIQQKALEIIAKQEKTLQMLLAQAGTQPNYIFPKKFITDIQKMHTRYLMDKGAKKDAAQAASKNLIPDTVSAKTITDILSVLKHEAGDVLHSSI